LKHHISLEDTWCDLILEQGTAAVLAPMAEWREATNQLIRATIATTNEVLKASSVMWLKRVIPARFHVA